jgi:predicted branched-subunit amino acid permease
MTATTQQIRDAGPEVRAVRAGVAAALPFVVGLAPFAFVIGSAAAEGDALAGWAGSWLVYGGSAHLATLRAIGSGLAIAVATGLIVNARLLVYSASLASRWRTQPRWFRLVAAALVIDPTWAIVEGRPPAHSPADERRFFLAAGLALGAGWSTMIAVGAAAGGRVGSAHLAVAVPVCLAALVAPALRQARTRRVFLVAAVTAWLASGAPAGVAVLIAIGAGALAGAVSPRRAEEVSR